MKFSSKIFSIPVWLNFLLDIIIEVYLYIEKQKKNISCKKKIKRILHTSNLNHRMTKKEISQCKSFCKDNFYGYNDALWHRAYYGINGIWSVNYIPEHFFYIELENLLNPFSAQLPFMDKNNFDRLFPDIKKPKTIIRKIDGEYYDNNYKLCSIDDILKSNEINTMIVKPTINGRGGRGIAKINSTDILDYLKNEKCSNLIVQEQIKQHGELSNFNNSSVNTLKISTVKIRTNAVVCSTRLRIGKENSIVDNPGTGGLFIGVNRDGSLRGHFLCKIDNYSKDQGHSGFVKDRNFKIPSWNKLNKAVINLHNSIPGLRFLSWDMAIDATGDPILIEVNTMKQDINNHQFANGPLFGDKTEEVLEWYKKQKGYKTQPLIKLIR